MNRLLGALLALTAVLGWSQQGLAAAITLLNTFPAPSRPYGPDAGLFAEGSAMREIAVPFTVHAPGRITEIATGIDLLGFGAFCMGIRLSVVSTSTLHTTPPFEFGGIEIIGLREEPELPCSDKPYIKRADVELPLAFSDLNWFVERGEYWLVATFIGDLIDSRWLTNPEIVSDEWAIRGLRCPNQGWYSPSECNGEPGPIPVARIMFEPGIRVPEPDSLPTGFAALVLAGLFCHRKRGREAAV